MPRGKYDRDAARLKRIEENRATPQDIAWLKAQQSGVANDRAPQTRKRRGRGRGRRRQTRQQSGAATVPAMAHDTGVPAETGNLSSRVFVFRPELIVCVPESMGPQDAQRLILERARTFLSNAMESRTKGGFREVAPDTIFTPPAPPTPVLREGVEADAIMRIEEAQAAGSAVQQPPAIAHDRSDSGLRTRSRRRRVSKGATITPVV
jgi:hypothetical protein